MLETLNSLDIQLFLFLNSLHSSFMDPIMFFLTGKLTWAPLYAVVLFYLFKKEKWYGILALVFAVLVIVFADQSSVKLFKNVFERLRPSHNPEIKDIVHIVNNKRGGQFGFVSSHAANTFGFAMFISLFFKIRWVSISLFTWAVVVSYTRIYLGLHYPGDILGGAILGSLIGFLVYQAYTWTYQKMLLKTQQNISKQV